MVDLLKSKTVWTSVAGLVYAGVSVALGDVTQWQAVQTGLTSLVAIFLRAAIERSAGAQQ